MPQSPCIVGRSRTNNYRSRCRHHIPVRSSGRNGLVKQSNPASTPSSFSAIRLIGTNDLAYGRSPALTADGIRANLDELQQHFPDTRVLLLGLLPREASPTAPLRVETTKVNRLIRDCTDGQHIFYAEIGDVLLDGNGQLTTAISPDALHFTARGYALLASRLDPELDRLLRPAR